ncbi:Chemotaxis protein CheY [Maioricimonas rarisocia]|uniref:Chemotaxis protein CheY n=1 Tax=Maioricimonas rarisocia TaxID=2528026 RepID=A0A517Z979_9PLAN|nr:response regulator [Maioricimonas rarisocia]QDU39026.1 Chemotaxis protein CheY [Maioricimonas rarisocia]
MILHARTPASGDAPSVQEIPPRILVVDDSPVDQRLAGSLLQQAAECHVDYACNGQDAWNRIQTSAPDLVLTDLQMPEMDGLALVETVRKNMPLLPVVLMTAFGSEQIATEALQRGAASYVAKAHLARSLMRTVQQVLSLTHFDRQQRRLGDFWDETRFCFTIENDVALIPALVTHLQDYLARMCHCDQSGIVRVGVALHEALRNAIHHGNLELDSSLREDDDSRYYALAEERRRSDPYQHRKVTLTASESPEQSTYVIRDEGPGFDTSHVHYDPDNLHHLTRPSGRGLFLIQTFMDEVRFNDQGNEITMIHRRPRSAEAER